MRIFYFLLCVIGLLSSCIEADKNKTIVVDIYTECQRNVSGELQYAPVIICQANSAIKSVDVFHSTLTNPISLKAYDVYKTTFAKTAETSDFKLEKPATGTYSYSVVFEDGETRKVTESLSGDIVEPVVIDTEATKWNTEKNQLEFDWNDVANASYYAVRLYTIGEDTKKIYASPLFKNASSYQVKQKMNDQYWANDFTPQNNQTFRYEVVVYKMEAGSENRLEGLSRQEGQIKWVGLE